MIKNVFNIYKKGVYMKSLKQVATVFFILAISSSFLSAQVTKPAILGTWQQDSLVAVQSCIYTKTDTVAGPKTCSDIHVLLPMDRTFTPTFYANDSAIVHTRPETKPVSYLGDNNNRPALGQTIDGP